MTKALAMESSDMKRQRIAVISQNALPWVCPISIHGWQVLKTGSNNVSFTFPEAKINS